MSFTENIEKFKSITQESYMGKRFEFLMMNYLLADPLFSNEISSVSLWNDFEYKNQIT
jgi:predicted helicase